ncbi:MAG TPA: AzlD domain-containing protein [Deltaproteobacteria bacterium]|nr:AzlD domain-containing protein [Deltaproteobacteria bacterium]HOI07574.1 AzlD domain-containing protein [Deltaproteobacteria bacterium]
MIREHVVWIIVGTAVVTVIPRVVPLVLLSRMRLPALFERWLSYVPVAVLAALLAQAVAMPDGRLDLTITNPALLALVPVLVIAMLTRSLIGTVTAGIMLMALLRWMQL